MEYEYNYLEDKDTEEIIRDFVDHVSKSEEQIKQEGEQEIESTTHLKIFVAENNGLELGNTEERIEELIKSGELSDTKREFFAAKNIREEKINFEASYLEIGTPKYDRVDRFVVVFDPEYIRVYTTERKHWTERTIENLISYIPELNRLFLSSDDLEDVVSRLDTAKATHVSGFTAKYQPYYRDQSVTIQFHGGSKEDLNHVEEEFNARPSRLEFSQENSPVDAIQGAIKQDGYISIPQIREGSEAVGVDTTQSVTASYERLDQKNFEIEYKPKPVTPGERHFLSPPEEEGISGDGSSTAVESELKNEYVDADHGRSIEGFTVVRLVESVDEKVNIPEETLIERLEEDILDYKKRYRYSSWNPGHYVVFDSKREESLEITVEDSDILLHAKSDTTKPTLRDFYQIIYDEFNTTYEIDRKSKQVRA